MTYSTRVKGCHDPSKTMQCIRSTILTFKDTMCPVTRDQVQIQTLSKFSVP